MERFPGSGFAIIWQSNSTTKKRLSSRLEMRIEMEEINRAIFAFRKAALLFLGILVLIILVMSCVHIQGQENFLPNFKGSAIVCVVPGTILFSVLLLSVFKWISNLQIHNKKKVSCLIWGIIIFIQSIFVFILIKNGFKGITDTERIINEAIAMVGPQGGRIDNEAAYFSIYGNNYPFTILIYYLCRIMNLIGLHCYTDILIIINVILIDLSGFFAFKLIRMLRGSTGGICFLVLFLVSPTTYVWIAFTYTNTFSMPFIMGLLYWGIKMIRKKEHRARNIVFAALWGAIGYQIRPTTIIPMIAVGIGILLTVRIKSGLEKTKLFLVFSGIFVGVMILSLLLCQSHLKNTKEDRNFPFTHWIMMGLNEKKTGFINDSDVKFSMSFPRKTEKIEGNLKEIKERFSKMGPFGYLTLITKKMNLVWSVGTDGNPRFYSNGENISWLHQYIWGDKNGLFVIYCQIFRSFTFLFILISIYYQFRRKRTSEFFVISLTMLGAVLFLILWEANQKYNICFMNILYILMSDGITRTLVSMAHWSDHCAYKEKQRCWYGVTLLLITISLGITVFMVSFQQFYLYDSSEYRKIVIQDVSNVESSISLLRKGDVAEQTFTTQKAFNEIRLMCKNNPKAVIHSYRIELINGNGDRVIGGNLEKLSRNEKGWLILNLEDIPASADERLYTLRILCMDEQKEGLRLSVTPHDTYDLYENGSLIVDSRPQKKDMVFSVSQKSAEPLMRKEIFYMLILGVWILAVGLILFVKKTIFYKHCVYRM